MQQTARKQQLFFLNRALGETVTQFREDLPSFCPPARTGRTGDKNYQRDILVNNLRVWARMWPAASHPSGHRRSLA